MSAVSLQYQRPELSGGWLRLLWRGPSLLLFSTGMWLSLVLGRLLLRPWPELTNRLRHWIFRNWGRGACWLFGLELDVRGEPPTSPGVLVSNHLSYLDIPIFASQMECTFVAKQEIDGWPLAGQLCRAMNTIFVDRSRNRDLPRVNADILNALKQNWSVVVFPEGRSTHGDCVEPFKSSLLEPAASQSLPVNYAAIRYETPRNRLPAREMVCFWGDVGFGEHVIALLRQPSGYRAVLEFGVHRLQMDDRKLLTEALHTRVTSLYERAQ